MDFSESFSPAVDKTTIRLFLSIAASLRMKIIQFDIPSAFTLAELREEVFVKMPEEFFPEGKGKVFRLSKALYGLKQSPLAFFRFLKGNFADFGMTACQREPCFFYTRETPAEASTTGFGIMKRMAIVHVDDGKLAVRPGKDEAFAKRFLKEKFNATISDDGDQYLAIDVRWVDNCTIGISQSGYIRRLMQKFSVSAESPPVIPMKTRPLLEPKSSEEAETGFPYMYKELVGALIYVSCCTRPDISFAVNKLAQFYSSPSDSHYSAALQVLSYLGGTADMELHLGGRGTKLSTITAYIDADFAEDVESRKSVSGIAILVNNSLVAWSSRRQRLIAHSTTEAEYLAVYYGRNEVVWIQQFLEEIGLTEVREKTRIMQDNKSTISLITDGNARGRTKYFDLKLRIVHTDYIDGLYKVEYYPSKDMVADVLTKPLGDKLFLKFRDAIMGNT